MHGILKQDAGPYLKGTEVATDPKVEASVVCVDSVRFAAWQAAGLLKAVKKGPAAERAEDETARERAAAFVEKVTGEAPDLDAAGGEGGPDGSGVEESGAPGSEKKLTDDAPRVQEEEPHG